MADTTLSERLLLMSAISGCIGALAGQYVIAKQHENLKKWTAYAKSLTDALEQCVDYVPEHIMTGIVEQLKFEAIVREV